MAEIQNIRNVGGASPVDRAGRTQNRRTDGSSAPASGDSLEISSQARFAQELEQLLAAAHASADLRPSVVDEARSDLVAGTLDNEAAVSGSADSILDMLT